MVRARDLASLISHSLEFQGQMWPLVSSDISPDGGVAIDQSICPTGSNDRDLSCRALRDWIRFQIRDVSAKYCNAGVMLPCIQQCNTN